MISSALHVRVSTVVNNAIELAEDYRVESQKLKVDRYSCAVMVSAQNSAHFSKPSILPDWFYPEDLLDPSHHSYSSLFVISAFQESE